MSQDHVTSNTATADELRALATKAITDLWVLVGGQQTEIERLTRERDELTAKLSELARGWAEAVDWKTERDRLRALVQRAHAIISIREAAHETHKGKAWLEQATRELNGEPASAPETSRNLPGDGTRRAAFNAWWQEMWKDNDPRSSPGFDEQMRSWSLDAWQAGAAHERARISAISSALKASGERP